eukprot:Skav230438  [mRNA]  locus=scaffold1601:232711:233142:+ [translate_table: standard]
MDRQIDTLELDLDGWDQVADDENSALEEAAATVAEAEATQDQSDSGDEASIPDDGANVFARLSKFEASKKPARPDPFWLEQFFEITESLSDVYESPSNLQQSVNLLSGCSGLLAEGWACKAGIVLVTLCPCYAVPGYSNCLRS